MSLLDSTIDVLAGLFGGAVALDIDSNAGNAAGPTGAIQWNNGGAFDGSADFTWDPVTGTMVFGGGPFLVGRAMQDDIYLATAAESTYIYMDVNGVEITDIILDGFMAAGGPITMDNVITGQAKAAAYDALFANLTAGNGTTAAATVSAVHGRADVTGTANFADHLFGTSGHVFVTDATVAYPYGAFGGVNIAGAANYTHAAGGYFPLEIGGTSIAVDGVYGVWVHLIKSGTPTIPNAYQFYAEDMAGFATQPYYLWLDSRGVYRIREDNVADGAGNPQAVAALYNPRFTKYTPGAANFERIVQQWIGNVAVTTTEAGGTGTLRAQRSCPITTVGALPAAAAANQGATAFVTDSNTVVWGALAVGGGANKIMVVSNGATWTVMGK